MVKKIVLPYLWALTYLSSIASAGAYFEDFESAPYDGTLTITLGLRGALGAACKEEPNISDVVPQKVVSRRFLLVGSSAFIRDLPDYR